jgi:hypothetical protein
MRIQAPWLTPKVPNLVATHPARETPIVLDDLSVFPDGFLLRSTPFSFDVVRTLYWHRTYTDVRNQPLGDDECIEFSFTATDPHKFRKKYNPMLFTQHRRTVPNAMWSAFTYISRASYTSRIDAYAQQISKFKRWTIEGTTFDLNGFVIRGRDSVRIANATIRRTQDGVLFSEIVPHNGWFSKTKKTEIEAFHTTDFDCFYPLLEHFLKIRFA